MEPLTVFLRLLRYLLGIFYMMPPKESKGPKNTTSKSSQGLEPKSNLEVGRPTDPEGTTTLSVTVPLETRPSPSEEDPRVSWIYRLTKEEIVSMLESHGLPTEGTMKEARQRLVIFHRMRTTTPEMENPVSSKNAAGTSKPMSRDVTTLGNPLRIPSQIPVEDQLNSIKEILGLPPTTDEETLRRRLSEMVTTGQRVQQPTSRLQRPLHPASLELPPPHWDPVRAEANKRINNPDAPTGFKDTAAICTQARKWNIKFDGGSDVVSFLERLEELMEAYEIERTLILRALPELFKGKALLWYRNNKDFWRTYDDFLEAVKRHFLPAGYNRTLDDEIRRRTQGQSESFRDFVIAICTLMRRRCGYASEDQLDIIYQNMLPDYKLTIRRDDLRSIGQFIEMAENYESYLREKNLYRPPPNPSQALVPETAYYPNPSHQRPGNLGTARTENYGHTVPHRAGSARKSYPNWPQNTQIRHGHPLSPIHSKITLKSPPEVDVANTTKDSQEDITCWNCDSKGHRFEQCQLPKRIRCFNCKKEGIRTIHCPCRSGNAYRGQGRGGTLDPKKH